MRYLLVVAVCLSIYFLPFFVPARVDMYFYVEHSLLSLSVICLVCLVGYKPLTAKIILVEIMVMCLDLLTCVEHYTNYTMLNASYRFNLNVLCSIEALLLVGGAPWDAIHKRFRGFLANFGNNLKHNTWFL